MTGRRMIAVGKGKRPIRKIFQWGWPYTFCISKDLGVVKIFFSMAYNKLWAWIVKILPALENGTGKLQIPNEFRNSFKTSHQCPQTYDSYLVHLWFRKYEYQTFLDIPLNTKLWNNFQGSITSLVFQILKYKTISIK